MGQRSGTGRVSQSQLGKLCHNKKGLVVRTECFPGLGNPDTLIAIQQPGVAGSVIGQQGGMGLISQSQPGKS